MNNSTHDNDSYLDGLTDAIQQIISEYDCCKMEFEGETEKLDIIKMAFSRAIGLIEDQMIQNGGSFRVNLGKFSNKL